MKQGVQTRIGTILPKIETIKATKLSKDAKARLNWIDYYIKTSNQSLTCRRYGISRVTMSKWLKRYKTQGLVGLESWSNRPHKLRRPTTPVETLGLIKTLRTKHPEYSKYKLSVILKRDHDLEVSASTVGRVIKKYDLFFRSKRRRLRTSHRGLPKAIKPKGLKAKAPGEIYEFDLKHIPQIAGGHKHYAINIMDIFSKKAFIKVTSSPSAKQAALAWDLATKILGVPKIVITDHGSENLGEFSKRLKDSPTKHYFARVRQPKDKPFIERLIGTLERECLSLGGVADTVKEQQEIIDRWLVKYHYYRPHAALNYLTPYEFIRNNRDSSDV